MDNTKFDLICAVLDEDRSKRPHLWKAKYYSFIGEGKKVLVDTGEWNKVATVIKVRHINMEYDTDRSFVEFIDTLTGKKSEKCHDVIGLIVPLEGNDESD